MIPLMKHAFLDEVNTKKALADFITGAQRLSMDEQCFAFEKEFAAYQGRRDAVLFNSGGSANVAMLQALKNLGRLKDGDTVGFSALTWSTNVMPIIQLGLRPVIVDCSPHTLNVMADNLKDTLSHTPLKAFFTTNVLGLTGDMIAVKDLCAEHDIILLEDNCESLGTVTSGVRAGNFGLAASFSFFVAHHMSTIEGGMVCTDDEDYAEMLRIVRANGWDRNLTPAQQQKWRAKYQIPDDFQAKYSFYDLGFNLRPTEITGFLGRNQLKLLDENIRARQSNHAFLVSELVKNDDLVPLLDSHISTVSSFAFVVLAKTPELRKKYLKRFTDAEIEIRPVIAGNMQKQPFYN
jgi:CDP-6-deoxy-D-xylo-4-hexulose-3-dehydrase